MRSNLFKRGTMLVPSGPRHDPDRLHLHIICSNPDEDGHQLVVSCSSIKGDLHDRTCVLRADEHHTFDRPTFVSYAHAVIIRHDRLIDGVSRKLVVPCLDLNSQTFLRVTRGIPISPQTPRKVKTFYLAGLGEQRIAA